MEWAVKANSIIDISYMKAPTDTQTCLVALRYDEVAAGVSTDEVTHTL